LLVLLLTLLLPPLLAQTELQKAIEEFKVQTGNLGLRADSTAKQIAAGRGTTPWHGRIFENFRNDFLDAIPHEVAQRGGTKSLLRRNQFGFNVSGPVIIPRLYHGGRKTFFSFSYEGVRDHTARSFLQTIATTPERAGDFSATVDQAGAFLPIYDPSSTRPNPGFDSKRPVSLDNLEYFRTPFPGNRIDAVRVEPVARKALEYYPAPNAAAGPFFRNNYFLVTPETNNADGVIAKVDHNIREKHRFSVNLNNTRGFNGSAALLPTAANPGSPDRTYHNRAGTIEHVFTKSPQTVNTARFRVEQEVSTTGERGQPDYAGKLGLSGSSAMAFPAFSISPYVGMGRSYPVSRFSVVFYNWRDSLSIKHGKHSLTFTVDQSRVQISGFQSSYPAGNFRFEEGLTSLPGIVGTGHSFASFLAGLAGYAEKSYVISPSYFRANYGDVSVREQYQAAKSLTLTLTLYLSHMSPRFEKYNRQSSVDLSAVNPANGRPGAMIVTGLNGVGRAFEPYRLMLGPSASLAWNPRGDSKTVLRASLSRSDGASLTSSQWGTQAFNPAPVYLSPNPQLEPALRLGDGLPPLARPLPDLRPEALNDTNADLVYRGRTQPTYDSASLSIERQLPFSTMLTLGASHSGARDTYVGNSVANLNAIPLAALAHRDQLYDEDFNRSLRPYPQYKSLNVGGLYPLGRYRREAAYVSVEKRATAGLSLSFRYDWTKQRDDYSGTGRQDYLNRRNEWSLSFVTPHRVTLTYMYELPIGRGKALLAYSDWRRHLVDGWSLSGSSSYSSGEPVSLRPQFNNTGGVISALRVNVVPGVDPRAADPGPDGWFNPTAFDQPADFTLGNASRAHPLLRNPPNQNHDVTVSKRFSLASGKTLEFNAVGLNFMHHANWNDPDAVIGPLAAPNVNAGKIIGTKGGRVLQLGLRFSF
jgi:hypothetical protein